MKKSEFLKEISSLSREEIQKRLLKDSVRKKKIYPAVYTRKKGDEDKKCKIS